MPEKKALEEVMEAAQNDPRVALMLCEKCIEILVESGCYKEFSGSLQSGLESMVAKIEEQSSQLEEAKKVAEKLQKNLDSIRKAMSAIDSEE